MSIISEYIYNNKHYNYSETTMICFKDDIGKGDTMTDRFEFYNNNKLIGLMWGRIHSNYDDQTNPNTKITSIFLLTQMCGSLPQEAYSYTLNVYGMNSSYNFSRTLLSSVTRTASEVNNGVIN